MTWWSGIYPYDDYDFDTIIELITSEVDRSNWDDVGGCGSIEPFFSAPSLVVHQTLETHAKIEDLLARLRKLRKLENPPARRLDLPHVAVHRLRKGAPVEKTIQLLRQMVPEAATDNREGNKPTYLESFRQGILVCHTPRVHRRVHEVLGQLDLCPPPPKELRGMGGMGGGGMGGGPEGMGGF